MKFPLPCILSPFQKPSYSLPSTHLKCPYPSRWLFLNSPQQVLPSGRVMIPWPSLTPLLKLPQYQVPLAHFSCPQPCCKLLSHYPVQEVPSYLKKTPFPSIRPSSHYPSYTSPLLKILLPVPLGWSPFQYPSKTDLSLLSCFPLPFLIWSSHWPWQMAPASSSVGCFHSNGQLLVKLNGPSLSYTSLTGGGQSRGRASGVALGLRSLMRFTWRVACLSTLWQVQQLPIFEFITAVGGNLDFLFNTSIGSSTGRGFGWQKGQLKLGSSVKSLMPHNISYTHIASILLKEINRIRNDPALLLPILEERKEKYDEEGNYYPLSGLNFSVRTKEGKQGVLNLIDFVRKQRESPSLEWSYELHQAADKRCHFLSSSEEQNVLNRVANLQVGELVSEFTTWRGQLVELTFYGFIEPREYICELLLEDGRDSKENRVQFFNRMACYIGIGINTHEKYRFVIVLIMANQVATHQPIASLKNLREDSIRESSFSNNRIIRQNSRGGTVQSGTGMNQSASGSNNARERKNSSVNVNIRDSRSGGKPEDIERAEGGQQGENRVSAHQPYFQAPIYSPGAVQGEENQENLECRIEDCLIY